MDKETGRAGIKLFAIFVVLREGIFLLCALAFIKKTV